MRYLSRVLFHWPVVQGAGGRKVHWHSWKMIGRSACTESYKVTIIYIVIAIKPDFINSVQRNLSIAVTPWADQHILIGCNKDVTC